MTDIESRVRNLVDQADKTGRSLQESGIGPFRVTIHVDQGTYDALKAWVADRVKYPNALVAANPHIYGYPIVVEEDWGSDRALEVRAAVLVF